MNGGVGFNGDLQIKVTRTYRLSYWQRFWSAIMNLHNMVLRRVWPISYSKHRDHNETN